MARSTLAERYMVSAVMAGLLASTAFGVFAQLLVQAPTTTSAPLYNETTPDQFGYTANPAGTNSTDRGVGAFLADNGPAPNPNSVWASLAPQFNGKFQVPTLRHVDMRP